MEQTLRSLLDHFLAALVEAVVLATDEDVFVARMRELGWDAAAIPRPFQDLASASQSLLELLAREDFDKASLIELGEALVRMVQALDRLKSSPDPAFPSAAAAAEYWSSIKNDLIDLLLVEQLDVARPTFAAALKLIGFIREKPKAETAIRLDFVQKSIEWSTLAQLLTELPKDAGKGFREAFDWASDPQLEAVVHNVGLLLEAFGLKPEIQGLDSDLLDFLSAGALEPDKVQPFALDLAWAPDAEEGPDFGVLLYVRPPTAARFPGVSLLPYARFSGTQEIPLSENLTLSIRGQADLTKGLAITVAPNTPILFESGFLGGAPSTPAEALIGLNVMPSDNEPMRLFGDPEGSQFTIAAFRLSAGGRASNKGSLDAIVEAHLDNARLVIKPGSDETDSFLASLLPKDGLSANFSLSAIFSSVTGFHLGGSGGLEASFPSRVQLGPIELQSVTIAVQPNPTEKAILLSAGATLAAKLGPLQAVVENMGIRADTQFPPGRDGNLGPIDIGLGFKPPSGVGLSLDLSVIKGGGFLRFDEAKGEYSGALEFSLLDFISVKALGIVTTKMPDGSPGYSLLLVLTAEFNPGIQLSFGFTLSGVGGIVGLHRAMSFDALLAGVLTGAISNVMFPRDVIANAPRILSDLASFFPARRDTFLIGPMLKIGWGTPTLITVSMGVVIEIPGNIAILGTMELALPDKELAILEINVAFAGGIDFDAKRIFFVAALYRSRVLAMTLEGGMGFYLSYGDDPVFVLTVGGFHPRFNPPALPFPPPARISISLLATALARIRVETYFAVTSNTAQFGARAELFFGLGPCEVSGQLSFDALFQFSPFYVIIEIAGSISLKVFGMGVFSIRLRFTLEGMTPWRARGEGSISFLFFDVSANFDISWGDAAAALERLVPVLQILRDEIAKIPNWKQVLPPSLHLLVTLRAIEPADDELVIHPLGMVHFSQRAIPLDRQLDKVGEQKPSDVKSLSLAATGDLAKVDEAREQFAPAQFEKLDAAGKLSRKSYEPMPSGLVLGLKDLPFRATRLVKRRVRYEEEIIDSNYRRAGSRFSGRASHLFDFLLRGSAVALSTLSQAHRSKSEPFSDRVEVGNEGFALVNRNDNSPYSATSVFQSEAEAIDHLRGLDSATRADLHVVPSWELAA